MGGFPNRSVKWFFHSLSLSSLLFAFSLDLFVFFFSVTSFTVFQAKADFLLSAAFLISSILLCRYFLWLFSYVSIRESFANLKILSLSGVCRKSLVVAARCSSSLAEQTSFDSHGFCFWILGLVGIVNDASSLHDCSKFLYDSFGELVWFSFSRSANLFLSSMTKLFRMSTSFLSEDHSGEGVLFANVGSRT